MKTFLIAFIILCSKVAYGGEYYVDFLEKNHRHLVVIEHNSEKTIIDVTIEVQRGDNPDELVKKILQAYRAVHN